ncbi:hypothetical protein DFH27DRAFT_603490 [Peziza echinospora]|nr:hypothetical protein DFH27DRAFT_603490 [Peziza echinospora]
MDSGGNLHIRIQTLDRYWRSSRSTSVWSSLLLKDPHSHFSELLKDIKVEMTRTASVPAATEDHSLLRRFHRLAMVNSRMRDDKGEVSAAGTEGNNKPKSQMPILKDILQYFPKMRVSNHHNAAIATSSSGSSSPPQTQPIKVAMFRSEKADTPSPKICKICLSTIEPDTKVDPKKLDCNPNPNFESTTNSTSININLCPLHPLTDFCHPCFQKWIYCELEKYHPIDSPKSRSHLHPRCPGGVVARCRSPLPYHVIQNLATPETFERYDGNLLEACLVGIPGLQRCLAGGSATAAAGNGAEEEEEEEEEDDDEEEESAGCGNMQEHLGSTDVPIMTCGECGGKTCVVCQTEMHFGATCYQAQKIAGGEEVDEADLTKTEWDVFEETILKDKEEEKNKTDAEEALKRQKLELEEKLKEQKQKDLERELSESWLKEYAKQCPGCASWIQKTQGCDHMVCHSKCQTQFCYACGVPYNQILRNGNHHHGVNCPHFRAYM